LANRENFKRAALAVRARAPHAHAALRRGECQTSSPARTVGRPRTEITHPGADVKRLTRNVHSAGMRAVGGVYCCLSTAPRARAALGHRRLWRITTVGRPRTEEADARLLWIQINSQNVATRPTYNAITCSSSLAILHMMSTHVLPTTSLV
jgi:hypothetical protein